MSLKSELDKFGGWPTIKPHWRSSDFNLEKTMAHFNWVMKTPVLVKAFPMKDISSQAIMLYVSKY